MVRDRRIAALGPKGAPMRVLAWGVRLRASGLEFELWLSRGSEAWQLR